MSNNADTDIVVDLSSLNSISVSDTTKIHNASSSCGSGYAINI